MLSHKPYASTTRIRLNAFYRDSDSFPPHSALSSDAHVSEHFTSINAGCECRTYATQLMLTKGTCLGKDQQMFSNYSIIFLVVI